MRKRTPVFMAISALALGSCGGNDRVTVTEVAPPPAQTNAAARTTEVEPAADPATAEVGRGGADAVELLTELFSYDVTRMEASQAMTSPDSAAHLYAAWQTTYADIVERDGWRRSDPSRVSARGDTVQVCGEGDCASYGDFTSIDGLIASFTVDGNEIEPRLGPAGEPITAGPVAASVLGSYRTVSSDTLGVLVGLSTTEAVSMFIHSATYVGTDGRQSSVADAFGPYELAANASADVALFFPRSDAGGRLVLGGYSETGGHSSFELELTVPAS